MSPYSHNCLVFMTYYVDYSFKFANRMDNDAMPSSSRMGTPLLFFVILGHYLGSQGREGRCSHKYDSSSYVLEI